MSLICALSWLEAMPDDDHQRFLDPVGAECESGSTVTTWNAGEFLALGKNTSAYKVVFAKSPTFENLMWEIQRRKKKIDNELPKFREFLIKYYRTVKKKDVNESNIDQIPAYKHQTAVVGAFVKLVDGLAGFYHQTPSGKKEALEVIIKIILKF